MFHILISGRIIWNAVTLCGNKSNTSISHTMDEVVDDSLRQQISLTRKSRSDRDWYHYDVDVPRFFQSIQNLVNWIYIDFTRQAIRRISYPLPKKWSMVCSEFQRNWWWKGYRKRRKAGCINIETQQLFPPLSGKWKVLMVV